MRPTAKHENNPWRIWHKLEAGVYEGQERQVSEVESTPTTPAADNDSFADAIMRNTKSDRFEILNVCGRAAGGRRQWDVGQAKEQGRRDRAGAI